MKISSSGRSTMEARCGVLACLICIQLGVMLSAPTSGARALDATRVVAAQSVTESAGEMNVLATIHPNGGIALGAETLRLTFEPYGGLTRSEMASKLRTLAAKTEFYVIVDGVSAEAPPEVVYSVYLSTNANDDFRGAADPRYIGGLDFFNALGRSAQAGRSEAINVTERVRSLMRTEPGALPLYLSIAPAGTPAEASFPRVTGIRLVAEW
jgi:hypothetical protein